VNVKKSLTAQAGRPGIEQRTGVLHCPIHGLPAWAVKEFAAFELAASPELSNAAAASVDPPTPPA
jgi:hypothetical protein